MLLWARRKRLGQIRLLEAISRSVCLANAKLTAVDEAVLSEENLVHSNEGLGIFSKNIKLAARG